MTEHSSARILPTHTPELFARAVQEAAALLRADQVVALPTETVYGLAANALSPHAVQRIYEVKGRPAHNPIIVHVASLEQARQCAAVWPPVAEALAAAFWPGPLTIVLPRAAHIPDIVAAGGPTVGIRWPSHPFMQEVIRACGFPLAAPSANRSNEISPTNAAHVSKSLGHRIPLVVDGGQAQVGIESTVIDLSGEPPRVLRPGMIHEPSLLAVTGALGAGPSISAGPLPSPGMLLKHYAPKARLLVAPWRDEEELAVFLARHAPDATVPQIIAHTHVPLGGRFAGVSVIPHDAEAFARALYAELHRCDESGADLIVVEALPEGPEWQGIADRLKRAASA
jgi:L-threonylcarbamoyladenylate synthase